MMDKRNQMLRDFFDSYARVSCGPEPGKLAEFYDASFLAAGPKGGAAFRNDDAFQAWLREVHAFNVKSGMQTLTVDGVDELPVGAGYSLVRVTWAATFERTRDRPIRFKISYLLREFESCLKVAAYISHEDQEDAMRAHGLL